MDCVAQYFIDINFTECCHSDTGDNYFTTDFFLYALLSPSLFLPSSKPFHSCRELVLHKLPRGILNQSPATKGESVWLITEQCTQHALQTNTHRARGRGASNRGADTIAENMVRGGEGEGGGRKGDQPIWKLY